MAQSNFHLDNYYQSPVDKLVTIKAITVLPFTDNTKGIYAKSFNEFVTEQVENNPKWRHEKIELIGRTPFLSDLEKDPNILLGYSKNVSSDAFIVGRVNKTENSIAMTLALFLAKDGLLFAKEESLNIQETNFSDLRAPMKSLLDKLFQQIPYDGMILSRKDNLVTLNLSKSDGILNGQDLTVAAIIKIKRHPKFNFLINSEKTILGKLRVKKVDDSLTFAEIVVEKEKGSIQKNAKIVGSHLASFSNKITSTKAMQNYIPGAKPANEHSMSGSTVGERWKPVPPPTFGKVGISGGIGLMKKDSGSAFSEDNIIPSITLDGEVWINNQWSAHALIHQGITSIGDPDNQANLSLNQSAYELLGGFNFRLGGVYGTKFELLAGYSRFTSSVENANPSKFSTLRYSGIKVGGDVITPITGNDILVGASLFLFLKPKLKERPGPSGSSSDNSVTQFRVYGLKKWQENFYFKGILKYDNFSTSFAREITASSLGERTVSVNLGIDYYF